MAKNKNDELNILSSKDVYEDWFGSMPISDESIEMRISIAEEIEHMMFSALTFIKADLKLNGEVDVDYYTDYISTRFNSIVSEYAGNLEDDAYMRNYISTMAGMLVENTLNHKETNYYFSKDRAINIAKNESNFTSNYSEEIDAIASGYKNKTWISQKDDHVRRTHADADGQTVSIYEPFEVGGCKMMFPMDTSYGAPWGEIDGCRCTIVYS